MHNFLLYIALLDMHGTTMPFHALEVPSHALALSEQIILFPLLHYITLLLVNKDKQYNV